MGHPSPRPYHHGALRPALIDAAVAAIDEGGVAAMTLRGVAKRAGVTHAAATYHFGDRAGLLTAVAAEGHRLLAGALSAAAAEGSFLDVGVAYVRFAVDHPAHFEVMFQRNALRTDDPDYVEAKAATASLLYGDGERDQELGVAAWSIVHGLATLWLDGSVPSGLGDDPEAVARRIAAHLRV